MLMEALCWKLLTRSTFVCGSSHANGPTTLENTVTRSSSFRTRFRPFTPRQPSSNKVIRHCYCYTYPYSRVYLIGLLLSYLVYFLIFLPYCLTLVCETSFDIKPSQPRWEEREISNELREIKREMK